MSASEEAAVRATEPPLGMVNRAKSRVRARVKHLFVVFQAAVGLNKACYHGPAKNAMQPSATARAHIFLPQGRPAV